MAWLDYKKAYDSVPHSWTTETLEMVGVAENMKLLQKGEYEDLENSTGSKQ